MRQLGRVVWILGSGLLLSPSVYAQTAPPANADCQACHSEPSLARANGRPVVVDAKALEQSVHGSFDCVFCHIDLTTVTEFPHVERLAPVNCATCHNEPAAGLAKSVHASVPVSASGPVGCVACHGPPHQIRPAADLESPTNKLRVATTCARCHSGSVAAGTPRGPAVAGLFADSIHAVALTRTAAAPTCSNCHTSHDIRRKTDLDSPVHVLKVAGTCGTCHMNQQRLYDESVHAELLKRRPADAPNCASCHTAHSIKATATDEWQLSAVDQCGTCHREALATYRDTFHGQVTALGFTPVAKCADCHQSHRVLRTSDARSTVAPANRLATCQSCHPSANENFAKYQPHASPHDRERSPVLYYTAMLMNGLLFGTFTFFGAHTVLWFQRERTGPPDDPAPPARSAPPADPAPPADAPPMDHTDVSHG